MQPAESAHASEVAWQGVLEEAAHELQGLQLERSVLARFALTIIPAQAAIGQFRNVAIAGGGFEDVAREIAQGVLARTGALAAHVPRAFPHLGGHLREQCRMLLEQPLFEERTDVGTQGFVVEEKLVARGHPTASIETQASPRNQIMDVGMKDEGATPGVEHAQHAQLRAQPAGIAGQILQGAGTGGKEQVQPNLGMRPEEVPQRLGHRESDQEVRCGQQESGTLALKPVVGIGLTALRTVPVVAGMIAVVKARTVGTLEELSAQGRGATAQDLLQDLPLPTRHRGTKLFEILRRQAQELLLNAQGLTTVAGGRVHQRSPMN